MVLRSGKYSSFGRLPRSGSTQQSHIAISIVMVNRHNVLFIKDDDALR